MNQFHFGQILPENIHQPRNMQKSIKKMSASRACTEIIWIFKKCINVTFNASITLFREFNGALLEKHAIPKGAHWPGEGGERCVVLFFLRVWACVRGQATLYGSCKLTCLAEHIRQKPGTCKD